MQSQGPGAMGFLRNCATPTSWHTGCSRLRVADQSKMPQLRTLPTLFVPTCSVVEAPMMMLRPMQQAWVEKACFRTDSKPIQEMNAIRQTNCFWKEQEVLGQESWFATFFHLNSSQHYLARVRAGYLVREAPDNLFLCTNACPATSQQVDPVVY